MSKRLQLVCVEDTTLNKFIVYYEAFPSIVVQVDKLEDAPVKMGEIMKTIVEYHLQNENIKYEKI